MSSLGNVERSAMATRRCQVGGRFSRCQNGALHCCQYCGRDFCETHTLIARDHEAVCARKPCREKAEDLKVHLAYKARVAERNGSGLCGVEGCGPHPALQCSLCRGFFCDVHLIDRMYPGHDGYTRTERRASVCPRCWDRRKVWRVR